MQSVTNIFAQPWGISALVILLERDVLNEDESGCRRGYHIL